MPYKIDKSDPRKVLHLKDGVWKVKQVCKTPEKAKAAIRFLYMKENQKEDSSAGEVVRKLKKNKR